MMMGHGLGFPKNLKKPLIASSVQSLPRVQFNVHHFCVPNITKAIVSNITKATVSTKVQFTNFMCAIASPILQKEQPEHVKYTKCSLLYQHLILVKQ